MLPFKKYGLFFVDPSSSCSRQTSYLMFRFLLFSMLCFPVVHSKNNLGIKFCYEKIKEEYRLNTTILKEVDAVSETQCAIHCVHDKCCRSANYKVGFDGVKGNCELLHSVMHEQNQNMKKSPKYVHLFLHQPSKPFNCSCLSCKHNETCDNASTGCICNPGSSCEKDIDECVSNPCHVNATCIDGDASYNCTCKNGFNCEGKSCTDIDECKSKPCDTNAKCKNVPGSFTCKCEPYYTGDGKTCAIIVSTGKQYKQTEESNHRLDSIVYKKTDVKSDVECKNQCNKDQCCRSVNFKKSTKSQNCEFLHAQKDDKLGDLKEDSNYDYFRVDSSSKSFNCSCFPCNNGVTCDAHRRKCKCKPGFIFIGKQCKKAKNCAELRNMGEKQDGVYPIDPDGDGSFNVSCHMTTNGGGWTVFQRRMDGSVDFYLGWDEYKNGFGNMSGEFWLGLDKINRLTKGNKKLRVDLEDFEGGKAFAKYNTFTVKNENNKFVLDVDGYSGNASDSLGHHNGSEFSTKYRDNDGSGSSCAEIKHGAWWYTDCGNANLNGIYHRGTSGNNDTSVYWYDWKSNYYSLKKTEMKIR